MKNKIKLLFAVIAFIGLTSCEEEGKADLKTAPVGGFAIATPITGESIVLSEATPTNPGISLTWSPADYTTQSVITYTVQVAANGTNFANIQDLGSTTNRYISIPSSQLNLASLLSGAVPFIQSSVDVRIKATSGTAGSQPTFSRPITYLITAYGCLNQYAVGAGIPSAGWAWTSPLTFVCDNNVLNSTTTLANGTFRFFTQNGNYGSGRNYPYYTGLGYKITSNLVNALDGDSNFSFTGNPGPHRIKIDENKKTISAIQGTTGANSNWLVGAATPGGWSWAGNNETELGLVKNGIYEVLVTLNNNEAFRVFLGNNGGDSWGLGDRNYPWYVTNGYTIDSELANALDGDSNFRYNGPTAVRIFRINSLTKVISVD